MKTKSLVKKGLFITLLFLFSSSTIVFAKEKIDYTQLAESGTLLEIQSAVKATPGLKNQTFGTNKETMLMIALKSNRDLEIIQTLVKAGFSLSAKAKDKRTPVMFCARFTSSPEVLQYVIDTSAMSKGGRKKTVLAKDKDGKTAFDYASKNPITSIYETLLTYADAPEPAEQKEIVSVKQVEEKDTPAKETSKSSSSMHTVTATFSPVAKKVETEPEIGTLPVTTQAAVSNAEEQPAVAETKSEPEAKPAAIEKPVAQTIQTVQPDTVQNVHVEQEKPLAPAKTEEVAKVIETKPYTKSYLYDYMNDATPQTPEKEEDSESSFKIEDVNKTDKNGVTLLMKAAKAGNDWDVQNLLNNNADVQLRDKDGWSALMYAVRYQNSIRLVNMLIEKGAYTRVRNKYNATPLLLAADYTQNPQILSLLLRNRSTSEDEVFKAFILSLTSNVGSEHIQVTKVQLFLNMGVSVNRVWKGKTPLMYACQYSNSTAVIQLLLDEGALIGKQNVEGKTAFDFAKENTRLSHDDIYWSLNSVEN